MYVEKNWEVHRHFYETCCDLLELPQQFKIPHYRLTRWNNRNPGNGRMEGYGQIRMYAPNLIHVSLRYPRPINKTFDSPDAVYDLLRSFGLPKLTQPA